MYHLSSVESVPRINLERQFHTPPSRAISQNQFAAPNRLAWSAAASSLKCHFPVWRAAPSCGPTSELEFGNNRRAIQYQTCVIAERLLSAPLWFRSRNFRKSVVIDAAVKWKGLFWDSVVWWLGFWRFSPNRCGKTPKKWQSKSSPYWTRRGATERFMREYFMVLILAWLFCEADV